MRLSTQSYRDPPCGGAMKTVPAAGASTSYTVRPDDKAAMLKGQEEREQVGVTAHALDWRRSIGLISVTHEGGIKSFLFLYTPSHV